MSRAPSPDSPIGIAVVDKPPGWTSHQVVGCCRRIFGTRKVGHAGTLDPMATGVLIVGVNRATRLLGHLMLTEKEYTATIRLGITTVTDDAEGDVTTTPGCAPIEAHVIRTAIEDFTGDIQQVPTAVSAIKVDGRRAYARVRAGEDVELKARPVTVHDFRLLDTRKATAHGVEIMDCDVVVRCSSGTYIRALARDLGAALGSGGHLTALRRTRVGPFGLDRAQSISTETDHLPVLDLATVARECFPVIDVDETTATAVSHGKALRDLPVDGVTALLHEERFLGLYVPDGSGGAKAEAVFI